MRVSYILKDKAKAKIGMLDKIDSETITVNDKMIEIAALNAIGRKKKGSVFGIFILGALGGTMFVSAYFPEEDPCPSCQTVSVEGEGLGAVGKALFVIGGATLMVFSFKTAINNHPRDIQTKWKLDIVE